MSVAFTLALTDMAPHLMVSFPFLAPKHSVGRIGDAECAVDFVEVLPYGNVLLKGNVCGGLNASGHPLN
jgi:hypothetical protein